MYPNTLCYCEQQNDCPIPHVYNTSVLRHPLILVHGLFGFDSWRIAGWEAMAYFRGIGEMLKAKGVRVAAPRLSPTSSVKDRAEQLTRFVNDNFPNEKVHVIAHSMGGLDSRFAISQRDLPALSLTTIGTPHRGSSAADVGVSRLEGYLKPWLQYLKIPHEAFYDLMTDRCQEFNEKNTDLANVNYYAIAGRNSGPWLSPEWWVPYGIVMFREGVNDGIVSVSSACHHYEHDLWEGDHLSLVNWPNPRAIAQGVWRNRQEQFLTQVERLKKLE
jgi:triacylglycerol lipase